VSIEKGHSMEHHILELSSTLNPSFIIEQPSRQQGHLITPFELSMLCGAMAHPSLTFSVSDEGDALSIEWVQKFPI
jgi:hypothetical protein